MYRLTSETATSSGALAHTRSYEYDRVGNRKKQVRDSQTITYSYNDNDQLTSEVSSTTTTYFYDPNGSLTNKTAGTTTNSYGYDLKNKLTSVAVNGATSGTFTYDHQGIRVRSFNGSTTRKYLVDHNNHTGYSQILEELNVSGGGTTTLDRTYVIGDDVLGQCVSGSSGLQWLLADGHGSTRQLLSGIADVTTQYHYDAYGDSLTPLGTDPATSLLYCREQYDPTLAMYNLRARFYDPSNGRFNAMDSFKGNNFDPPSLHKYQYCHGDPILRTDPSGKTSTLVTVVIVLLIIAILIATAVYVHKVGQKLSNVKATQADFTGLISGISSGVAQMRKNKDANPQTWGQALAGTVEVGERSQILIGGTTAAGRAMLTPGQQNIINYFEQSSEFNNNRHAESHPPPALGHGAPEYLVEWLDSEIERCEYAIDVLTKEVERRKATGEFK